MPSAEDSPTLREFLELRLNQIEEATAMAKTEMDRRLDGMNEFREQLNRQEKTYLPREEYRLQYEPMANDIRVLRESRAELAGKASQTSMNITVIIAIIGFVLSIVSIVIDLRK